MPKNKKAVGAGIAAAAVAAIAGAYFLYQKATPKQKKKIRGWALKAKGEVLERIEKLENISEKTYNNIVETVTKNYRGVKNINPKELASLKSDLKRHWKRIQKQVEEGKK